MRATRIKKILFSQHSPENFEKSPYADFVKKYNVKIDFYKLFQVEGISLEDFSLQKISILKHTAIIFTSKYAIDNFFRIIKELKIKMPATTKYFCSNLVTANHLRKYIIERDRKKISTEEECLNSQLGRNVFFSEDGSLEKLVEKITLYASESFLFPIAKDSTTNQLFDLLDEPEINYTTADMFKISFNDVSSNINIYSYNMLVLFSPYGVQTLMHNYPDFNQGNMIIGTFGTTVFEAAQEAGLNVQIFAPTPEHPSIFSAVDKYLKKTNTRPKRKKWKPSPRPNPSSENEE